MHQTLDEARREFVRQYLIETLDLTGWNVTKAAKLAGRNRTALYKVCAAHGVSINRGDMVGNAAWRELGA